MLTRDEQETTINYCAADPTAEIYSADPTTIRKLDKLTELHPEAYTCTKRDQYGAFYTMPKKLIRFAKPASEARKAAARNSALAMLKKRA